MSPALAKLLALLERGPEPRERVFNPWKDSDDRDGTPRREMPARRLDNLAAYLEARQRSARIVLMGEAPSHRGCRFSGIAFCSEHELVHRAGLVARAPLALTSRDAAVKPFKERSAHVIWDEIAHAGAAYDVLLWNTFPWHPYQDSVTTNRKPRPAEVAQGCEAFEALRACFTHDLAIVAVGKVAQAALEKWPGASSTGYIRHPAQGGESRFRAGFRALVAASLLAASVPASSQGVAVLQDANLQRRADGVCALMGFTAVPDVTTGALSIRDGATLNPELSLVSIGGGFTWSRETPLYLEGTLASSRYNPSFLFAGTGERLPAQWTNVSTSGGVGWDFRIAEELVLRPILNVSLGHLQSDASAEGRALDNANDREVRFLQRGRLDLAGAGASVMLDYEHYRPGGEVDAELRYSDIRLRSTSGTFEAVQGHAVARSLSFWTRYRAPTGLTALDRPLRYVLEYAVTRFMGDLDGVLGFNTLNTFGVGLELDSSRYGFLVTRTRVMARFVVGNNVNGWSLGLAMSF